ncbi:MAG TPA: histidinol-phosphate transaminase [Thermoanaerobaculia bacterium]|nr:histidinol-phosphate transaminase [Thermoanaerobaculia bacterium]
MKPRTKLPSPRACVQALAPYVPGRPIEEVEATFCVRNAVKLASNENPLGPSPKAIAAAQEALANVHRYPDGAGTRLREALAARWGFPIESVLLGSGAAELIDVAVRAFVDPGEEVVVPYGIFRMFTVAVSRSGGTNVCVPTHADLTPDLPELVKHIGPSTKIVALANPNNPTGAYVSRDALETFLDALPSHVLAIVDEAYFEFAHGVVADYPNALDFLREGRNLLVLRTFSKAAGLAGLRIGYGFALPEIADALQKVREPFNTTSISQAAAIAALDDDEHVARTRTLVLTERAFLETSLRERGLAPYPSIANFLLVGLSVPFAPIESEFARRGVILRSMDGWGYPNAFRLSVGTHEENLRFLSVLDEVRAAGFLPNAEPAALEEELPAAPAAAR